MLMTPIHGGKAPGEALRPAPGAGEALRLPPLDLPLPLPRPQPRFPFRLGQHDMLPGASVFVLVTSHVIEKETSFQDIMLVS